MKLTINESNPTYKWSDYERFQDSYMWGTGRPTDASDEELAAAIEFLTKELRKSQRNNNVQEAVRIEKQLDILRDARKTKKKIQRGTYEIEQQITNDIWSCIHNTEVDFDALKEIRAKYKDYISLYRRIEKRILDKERWYD